MVIDTFFYHLYGILKYMRKLFLAMFVLSLVTFSLGAQEEIQEDTQVEAQAEVEGEKQSFFSKISWFVEGSVLLFPEDNGLESGPMPVLPSPGMGASYPFTKYFALELTLDLYYTIYGYSDTLDRAVPREWEHRSAQVIGPLLGIQAVARFDVTSFMTIRAFGGPAADLRIVLVAPDLDAWPEDHADASSQTDSVRHYFWSKGRWFMPVIGLGFDFTLTPRFKLGIDFRTWAPIYRLWTGEDLPAIEGWRFGPGLRLTIR